MRRIIVSALALTTLLPLPSWGASVTVRPGDTLSEIATRYQVSLRALMRLNGLANADNLFIGQTLKLPGSASGTVTAGASRHTVRSGETLSTIAVRYRVRQQDLITLNGLSNADNLYIGQTLKLPGGASGAIRAGASRHKVRSGETLSIIATRYRVRQQDLVALNGLANADTLFIGQTLKLPGSSSGTVRASATRHTVRSGETLSTIAARYRVRQQDLVALNGLANANHVERGQTLKLPQGAVVTKPKAAAKPKPVAIQANPNATSHTVARGQTLNQIAGAYQIPLATLIKINGINNPNKLLVGSKLSLRVKPSTTTKPKSTTTVAIKPTAKTTVKPAFKPTVKSTTKPAAKPQPKPKSTTTVAIKPTAKTTVKSTTKPAAKPQPKPKSTQQVAAKPSQTQWRTYGSLQVDWANWKFMGGSYVAPTLNKDGKALYLAVNCPARKINTTGTNGSWKTWGAPQQRFEHDLVKDLCKAKGG
ncbi:MULTISPECIES: LysM peptidoglycan-binding domain-containing protein [Prochlorococcus]|uniref:LysM peptidoglycan-binding domain-containing protein n=1 Tax=Prochlorococcus TaxID=1218 RepID=UPI0007B3C206|nr:MULTISPECIES: LysM peptidoglycan-binding domain-containing protein [Prochlorococcus]KZR67770.1 Peptidoglycan endopeptidase LytF precursor [Prochlorococcus marinus str. MIT 1312]KZR81633.1 Peptidoglycan endopeptidase LytF precursor [Prochlorococcus marinus str. MIT 1327]NMO83563.1 LysM peptidoglycan-binding domain-containing protein [Prochlorococcus sp. P1344]NMP05359.1 LysM peptidoglycan-binding domain-containing protein [Prochlorococcus sp. P1361]NMP13350.1 LysM peptidoglycan-binding domai